ncbi:MAG: outer membrane beta-barrel protein [Bacteroidota bacterium]
MRRYGLLLLLIWSPIQAWAYGQLGIKVAPGVAFSRVYAQNNNVGFSSSGANIKFQAGVMVDYSLLFRDNYFLSTGLYVAGNRVSVNHNKQPVSEKHQLQYFQVPLLVKLYTSEIALDVRLYVEIGPVLGIRIKSPVSYIKEGKQALARDFRWIMCSGLMGIGIQYDTSLCTSLFGGLSYQGAWTSALRSQNNRLRLPKIDIYNDMISLVVGVKF